MLAGSLRREAGAQRRVSGEISSTLEADGGLSLRRTTGLAGDGKDRCPKGRVTALE